MKQLKEKIRRNRRGIRLWQSMLVFLLIAAGTAGYVYNSYTQRLKPMASPNQGKEVVVEVPSGATSRQISALLAEKNLIRNDLVFRIYAKYTGLDNQMKAGKFHLNTNMSVDEIIRKLVKGETATISFTIPEGYTLTQIADTLSAKKLIDRDKFMELAANEPFDYDFLKALPVGPKRLEGYLFPDTYNISEKTTEKEIIEMMLDRFSKEMTPEFKNKAEKLGLTAREAVILASIIEREAMKDEERPKVAAVFLNRLHKNWKLESCATIQYILGKPQARLFNKDLEIESPYNTYKYPGFPPGPISSPGRASLQAAVNPANVDFMFFVVDEGGRHVFSRTLKEHNQNKAKYLDRLNNS